MQKGKAKEIAEAYATRFQQDAGLLGKQGITLSKAFAEYYINQAQHFKRPDMVEGNARILMNFFGRTRYVHDIDIQSLSKFVAHRRSEVSNATINRSLEVLSMLLKWLEQQGAYLTPSINIRSVRLKEPQARIRYISMDEAESLIHHAAPHLKPIIKLALLTGLRLQNILQMQAQQVKWEFGHIEVMQKSKDPNGKRNFIPITLALLSY